MKRSLNSKVALVIFLLAAVCGSLTAYLVYKNSTTALQSLISSNQTDEARQTMDKIDRFLYERMVDIQSLSGRQQLQDFLALPAAQRGPAQATKLNKELDDFKNVTGAWSELTIVDSQGVLPLPSSLQSLQTELAKQPSVVKLYAQALAGQIGYSDALSVEKGHEPVMLFMAPIRDQIATGHPVIGVMIGQLAWQTNLDILADLHNTQTNLINKVGISLGDNEADTKNEVLSKNYSDTMLFKNAQKNNDGSGIFPGIEQPKQSFLTSYVRESGYLDYGGNKWTLVLSTPKSAAFAPANLLAKNLILSFVIILIFAVPALLILLRLLVLKPVYKLEYATARLARGDFSHRSAIKSRDELGNLGRDFNKMADSIQFAYKSLRASTEESQNQRRTLETLLDRLPIGVFVAKAPTGEALMINRVGAQLLGRGLVSGAKQETYTEAYDMIKADGSSYPTDELPLSITLREGKTVLKNDVSVRRPNGSIIELRVASSPIISVDGQIRSAVAVFEDVSKEHELERSRDEFFSIASHELRTPLTAIMGNSSLIQQYYRDKLPDNDVREMVSDIHESSQRLIGIVNDFLDTSRLEQKRMKYEIINFDAVDVAKSVVKEYQVTGSRKKIQLEISKPLSPLPLVKADQNRTKQVLINLIGNALKFTENGSITISFKPEAKFLKILIADTGKGISPEAQKLLFHKFEQTGSTVLTRDSVRGTGLGLYISKLLTEQMGGSIRLESSIPGKGTTFSISLPIA